MAEIKERHIWHCPLKAPPVARLTFQSADSGQRAFEAALMVKAGRALLPASLSSLKRCVFFAAAGFSNHTHEIWRICECGCGPGGGQATAQVSPPSTAAELETASDSVCSFYTLHPKIIPDGDILALKVTSWTAALHESPFRSNPR